VPESDLRIYRQSQRRPAEAGRYNGEGNGKGARQKKQAAATLRSCAAGSQDESPCRAIHKFKGEFKGKGKG
jgi:hypothetical protein